ncbi:MAG: ATP-binding protein [bacterium]
MTENNSMNMAELNHQTLIMSQMAMHDTLNKLNDASLHLQLITAGVYGEVGAEINKELQEIEAKIQRTGVMVSDYMTRMSVIERGAPVRKDLYDLRQDIINLVLRELALDIKNNGIKIDNRKGLIPDGAVIIHADKLYLKVVYRNLIGNAINYGGPGTTISFGYEDLGDKWRFNVYNDGPPVPRALVELLFHRYKGENHKSKGSGLALYSIKKMIEGHGGEMHYETTESGHPNFVFTLPKERR